jgi:hypothetical protein
MGIVYLRFQVSYLPPDGMARITFVANFKLVSVSLRWAWSGLIMTNMRVFELPPRENCKRYVNCMNR